MALFHTLTIAIVILDAVAVGRNDLDFNLVGLRKAEALGKQAGAPLLRGGPFFVPLQRFVGVAVRCTQLCDFAIKD